MLQLFDYTQASRLNCCTADYSSFGSSCSEYGTTVNDTTYYCVSVGYSCASCKLNSNTTSESCSTCCAINSNMCAANKNFVSSRSWSKKYRLLLT